MADENDFEEEDDIDEVDHTDDEAFRNAVRNAIGEAPVPAVVPAVVPAPIAVEQAVEHPAQPAEAVERVTEHLVVGRTGSSWVVDHLEIAKEYKEDEAKDDATSYDAKNFPPDVAIQTMRIVSRATTERTIYRRCIMSEFYDSVVHYSQALIKELHKAKEISRVFRRRRHVNSYYFTEKDGCWTLKDGIRVLYISQLIDDLERMLSSHPFVSAKYEFGGQKFEINSFIELTAVIHGLEYANNVSAVIQASFTPYSDSVVHNAFCLAHPEGSADRSMEILYCLPRCIIPERTANPADWDSYGGIPAGVYEGAAISLIKNKVVPLMRYSYFVSPVNIDINCHGNPLDDPSSLYREFVENKKFL